MCQDSRTGPDVRSIQRSGPVAQQNLALRALSRLHLTPQLAGQVSTVTAQPREERIESSNDCGSAPDCSGHHRICGGRVQLHAREEGHRHGTDPGPAQADQDGAHLTDPEHSGAGRWHWPGYRGSQKQSLGVCGKTLQRLLLYQGTTLVVPQSAKMNPGFSPCGSTATAHSGYRTLTADCCVSIPTGAAQRRP